MNMCAFWSTSRGGFCRLVVSFIRMATMMLLCCACSDNEYLMGAVELQVAGVGLDYGCSSTCRKPENVVEYRK